MAIETMVRNSQGAGTTVPTVLAYHKDVPLVACVVSDGCFH